MDPSESSYPRLEISPREQALLMGLLILFGAFLVYFALSIGGIGVAPARPRLQVYHQETAPADVIEYFVDINTASVSELQLLPGVGEVTAQKIVDERCRNGRFESVQDLERVHGIGLKKVESLRAFTLPVVPTEVLVGGKPAPGTL